MANTIKLKRGSGSDPGSSDLAVGELAVRTDTAKLFTKNDGGSVVEVSGGVDDGDKGDITVSSSGATWTIDNDAVTFDKIANVPTARLIGRTSGGTGSIETLAAGDARTFLNVEDGATADQSASEILTLIKTVDGAGSGLDADTLDGVSSGSFLRSDATDTATGDITFSGGASAINIAAASDIRFENGDWAGDTTSPKLQANGNYLYICGGSEGFIFRENDTNRWTIDGSGHFIPGADSTYNLGSNGTRVSNGYFDTLYGDGSNLTGIDAGAAGGSSDKIFWENGQTVTASYTIGTTFGAACNAMSAGPITINNSITVTIDSGDSWIIV